MKLHLDYMKEHLPISKPFSQSVVTCYRNFVVMLKCVFVSIVSTGSVGNFASVGVSTIPESAFVNLEPELRNFLSLKSKVINSLLSVYPNFVMKLRFELLVLLKDQMLIHERWLHFSKL
jgi:hypothetical protein